MDATTVTVYPGFGTFKLIAPPNFEPKPPASVPLPLPLDQTSDAATTMPGTAMVLTGKRPLPVPLSPTKAPVKRRMLSTEQPVGKTMFVDQLENSPTQPTLPLPFFPWEASGPATPESKQIPRIGSAPELGGRQGSPKLLKGDVKPYINESGQWDQKLKVWPYNGQDYIVEPIGGGQYKQVLRFTEAGKELKVTLKDGTKQLVKCDEVVLKRPLPTEKPVRKPTANGLAPQDEMDVHALDAIEAAGIPVVIRYATPLSFSDPCNLGHGRIWIVEKVTPIDLRAELAAGNRRSVEFAKGIIQRHVNHTLSQDHELINDFRPDNVGENKKGELVVLDTSPTKSTTEKYSDWRMDLETCIKEWCGGKKEPKEVVDEDGKKRYEKAWVGIDSGIYAEFMGLEIKDPMGQMTTIGQVFAAKRASEELI